MKSQNFSKYQMIQLIALTELNIMIQSCLWFVHSLFGFAIFITSSFLFIIGFIFYISSNYKESDEK